MVKPREWIACRVDCGQSQGRSIVAEDKVVRDSAAQAKRIRGYIMPGDTLHALFDCNGGD